MTSLTGTTDVLRAEVGDVIFLPAGVEHSFMSVGPTGTTAVFGMARVADMGASPEARVSRNRLSELSRVEAAERGGAGAVCLLPVGSLEQHGEHLPVGTDSLLVETVVPARGGPAPARTSSSRRPSGPGSARTTCGSASPSRSSRSSCSS